MVTKIALLLVALFLFPQSAENVKTNRPTEESLRRVKLKRESVYQSWGCQGVDEPHTNPLTAIPPLVISSDRLLVTVCNTLYMLDSKKNVIWKWSTTAASIVDQPVIDSTGTIYVIALDMIWVALDAATGKEKWNLNGNIGRTVNSQIKAYKDNLYLVVVDMGGYRNSPSDDSPKDKLSLCKGKEIIWTKDFPAGAVLQVWGDRILAVNYGKDGVEITEILH
jgi:outer membrane protein assembly factor BamB